MDAGDFNNVAKILESGAIDVGATPTPIRITNPLQEGAEYIVITNDSNEIFYVGDSSVAVSGSSKGTPLRKRQSRIIDALDLTYIVSGVLETNGLIVEIWGVDA